ncbi:MAG: glutamine amidotransferase, partial [Anaerolineae bacterium]
ENASTVVPLAPLTDKAQVSNQVGTLRAGGGTDIFAGLNATYNELPEDPGRQRHIVLLTDGGASPFGIAEMVEENYEEHGITLSVIAIGQSYADFLDDLPEIADGRFHHAFNVDTIPEIFTEETVLATRAYIIEGEFFPALTSTSPILSGISGTPPLDGYVGSTIKPTAQQILVTGQEDPLLASWQYGLGRSVAWTSDATGRWASDWASWEEYARFWGQAVRWTITEGATQNAEVRVVQEGESVRIVVDAADDDGDFINGLEMEANIVDPDLGTTPVTLRQVAPGRYEGTFEPGEQGAYFVRIAGYDEQGSTNVAQTSGWVLSYSPEYRSFEGDPDFLGFIAGLTGGGIVEEPARITARNLPVEAAAQPVWPWLLLAAAILLPFDIAVRRLVITRADLVRLRNRLFPGQAAPAAPRSSTAGALLSVKDRTAARQENIAARTARPTPDEQPAQAGSTAASLLRRRQSQPEAADGAPPAPRPTTPPKPSAPSPSAPAEKPRPASGGSTASALLRRKREREQDED